MTSKRIERRFLPSVRAASENANRKRIQDLYLEVLRSEIVVGGNDRDILTDRLLFFGAMYVYIWEIVRLSGRQFFFFSISARRGEIFKKGARALAESCKS